MSRTLAAIMRGAQRAMDALNQDQATLDFVAFLVDGEMWRDDYRPGPDGSPVCGTESLCDWCERPGARNVDDSGTFLCPDCLKHSEICAVCGDVHDVPHGIEAEGICEDCAIDEDGGWV